MEGRYVVEGRGRETIDEVHSSGKGYRPVGERKVSMREEGETGFDNVTMASLCITIMFGSVRRRGKMDDALIKERRGKLFVFATIIREETENGALEVFFDQGTKTLKNRGRVRFAFEGIEPDIFSVMIDKNKIVLVVIIRINRRGPYIRKQQIKRGVGGKCRFIERQFVTFIDIAGITIIVRKIRNLQRETMF